jgi:alpha-L-rhamnosidase
MYYLRGSFILSMVALLAGISTAHEVHASPLMPVNLRCDSLTDPIATRGGATRLSWSFPSAEALQAQTAYQIIVSSTLEGLQSDAGDLWDSGRIQSDQSQGIEYGGKALQSRQAAFWKVCVWDQDGRRSVWSEAGRWQVGLNDESDWQASWIAMSEDAAPDSPETGPAPYLRKTFETTKPIQSATVHVSGLGYYELYLNGARVGDHVLAPAPTNYDARNLRHLLYDYSDRSSTRVLYNTFDVSALLKQGQNAIGVILGNGWYNQRDRRDEGWMWYDTPRMILQLEITYRDGTTERVVSDSTWAAATGALLHDGIFTGEVYDAGLEPVGWSQTGFDDSHWKKAELVRAPTGKLMAQLAPPDRVTRDIKPVLESRKGESGYSFDFGEMFSGWVSFKVEGPKGTRITLRHIEEMGGPYGQEDTYILSGKGDERYEPRFTWHAFRHVEIDGVPDSVTLSEVTGRVVHTDVERVGSFDSSNELFNRIYENYIRTQLGNFHGAFISDCPHRERLGYTADGQYLMESCILNFDMAQFYRKWLEDMADAQNRDTGHVPHTAPYGGGGGGPAWGASYVRVPWYYYQYYGDKDILKQHYPGMKHFVDYLGTRVNQDGLVDREEPGGWCLGEWANPDPVEIPPPFVNTCYYFHVADILSKAAAVLGEDQDASRYAELAQQIRNNINKSYFDVGSAQYWQNRQGANVFPMAFGIVPEDAVVPVLDSLVESILKNEGHFDTGILATPLMLDVLTASGREDIAFTLMNQRNYPGFGYILEKDATTLWEYWDGKLSHSHPMYGSVIRWFFTGLAGINSDPDQPGYKHIRIEPAIAGDLTHVAAEYKSSYGPIVSRWRIADNTLYLKVKIPPNTTATVLVPSTELDPVHLERKSDWGNAERRDRVGNRTVYEVTPGEYEFSAANIGSIVKPVHVATPVIRPRDAVVSKPDKAIISIQSATADAEIFYTLDSGAPDRSSTRYTAPFELDNTAEVSAIAYRERYIPSFTSSVSVNFVDPAIHGVDYAVYEGEWDERPPVELTVPVSSGRIHGFDVGEIEKREDHVAVVFTSHLEIDADGDYTFHATANDGCVLYLNEKVVVDNAGYFGEKATSGTTYLQAGRHPVRVLYFENTGSESMDIFMQGHTAKKQPIPPYKLFVKE